MDINSNQERTKKHKKNDAIKNVIALGKKSVQSFSAAETKRMCHWISIIRQIQLIKVTKFELIWSAISPFNYTILSRFPIESDSHRLCVANFNGINKKNKPE